MSHLPLLFARVNPFDRAVFSLEPAIGAQILLVRLVGAHALLDGVHHLDQVCGYQVLSLGKMVDAIKKGMSPNEAYDKNLGTYGRFKAEDGAVKWIDPRKE